MKKRHLQNCLSKEKKAFEARVEKYKSSVEVKCEANVESEYLKNIESVASISKSLISEPVTYSVESKSDPKASAFVGDKFDSVENMDGKTLTSSSSQNEVILSLLKEIVLVQKELKTRLEILEQNQANILHNQSVLSDEQSAILYNEQQTADKIDKIKTSIASKAEIRAQSKLLMECKITIKKVQNSVYRMTGETSDKEMDEVASMLPLHTLTEVQEFENKLEKSQCFAKAMTSYLYKLKGISEDVSSVIREIFTDDLLKKYNWDGRWGKKALSKLTVVNKILRDVFSQHEALNFRRSVRKAVERSHHRIMQKQYLITSRAEMRAQSKLLKECKLAVKPVEKSVCHTTDEISDKKIDEFDSMLPLQNLPVEQEYIIEKAPSFVEEIDIEKVEESSYHMIGEPSDENEVSSMLPLHNLAAVQEFEMKLENSPGFAEEMTSYLYKLKGTSEDVSNVIRAIFTDDLLGKYNWDGRWEKQSLSKLMLFNKILRDVFPQYEDLHFRSCVRKAVERSHHRLQQKQYLKKRKKIFKVCVKQ